ncbi:MAG: hypothetical protein IT323_11440, partial [Anaerolineae bacterium]|nr:hypothetical protein [Anaerolineae bacterium]
VASHIFRGLTPDELAVNYALDLGQVYAALAYYYQHKTAMDDQRRADVVRAEQLLADAVAEGMEAADITWLDEPEASSHSRQHVERHVLNTWQRTQRSAKK